jgi:O-antigen ligase
MLNRDQLDQYLERIIGVLLVAAIGFSAVLFGGVRNPEIGLAIPFALILWIVRLWVQPTPRLMLHPVIWPLLAFVVYAVWRSQNVTSPYVAERGLLQVVIGVVAFWVALQNLQRNESVRWLVHILVAVGCLIAGYAVLQLLRESDSVLWLQQPAGYSKRAGGTFVNPNHLAGFLCVLIPISWGVVFLGKEAAVVKVLHAYAALVMMIGVAVTMSRGGWFASAIGLLLLASYIVVRRTELRWPAAIAALVFGLAAFGYVSSVEKAKARITEITGEGTVDAGSSRIWLWRPAIAMWRDRPVTGVGPLHFDVEFAAYRPWQIQAHPGFTHNEYLEVLVDYGLVGEVLLGTAILFYVGGLIRTAKYVERGVNDLGQHLSNRSALFFGTAAGLGGLAVHCLVDFDLQIPAISLLAGLLGGVLAAHLRFATDRYWVSVRTIGRVLVTVGGFACLVWLVPRVIGNAREAWLLNEAAEANQVDENLLQRLRAAAVLAPGNQRTALELGENYRRLSFKGDRGWQTNGMEAIRWLEQSVRLNPRDPEAILALARTRQWLGDTNGAARDFDRALALGTNHVEVANHVAWNLLTRGRTNEAKALFDQSVKWNWYSNPMAITKKAELEAKGYK